jgi:glutamate-ammonia-ligase adenylyltransferase
MQDELLDPTTGLFDIKQDSGGIVDIEFLVQYLVLLNASKHSSLTKWTDMVRLLETLFDMEIIDRHMHHVLKEAYLSYRSAVHRLSLQEKTAKIPLNEFKDLRDEVTLIWNKLIGHT